MNQDLITMREAAKEAGMHYMTFREIWPEWNRKYGLRYFSITPNGRKKFYRSEIRAIVEQIADESIAHKSKFSKSI